MWRCVLRSRCPSLVHPSSWRLRRLVRAPSPYLHTLLVYACACGHPYHSYHPNFLSFGLPLGIPSYYSCSATVAASCSSFGRWRCPLFGVGGFLSCWAPTERGRRVVFMTFVRSAGALAWRRCALRCVWSVLGPSFVVSFAAAGLGLSIPCLCLLARVGVPLALFVPSGLWFVCSVAVVCATR